MTFSLTDGTTELLMARIESGWLEFADAEYTGEKSLLSSAPAITTPPMLARLFSDAAHAHGLHLGGDFEQHRLHGRYASSPS